MLEDEARPSEGKIPEEWRAGLIIPVWKRKGDVHSTVCAAMTDPQDTIRDMVSLDCRSIVILVSVTVRDLLYVTVLVTRREPRGGVNVTTTADASDLF